MSSHDWNYLVKWKRQSTEDQDEEEEEVVYRGQDFRENNLQVNTVYRVEIHCV